MQFVQYHSQYAYIGHSPCTIPLLKTIPHYYTILYCTYHWQGMVVSASWQVEPKTPNSVFNKAGAWRERWQASNVNIPVTLSISAWPKACQECGKKYQYLHRPLKITSSKWGGKQTSLFMPKMHTCGRHQHLWYINIAWSSGNCDTHLPPLPPSALAQQPAQ